MHHLDPDRLVLLALSEEPGLDESDHLVECAACRDEVAAMRDVATLSVEGHQLRDLPPPPEYLWAAIEAGIARPVVIVDEPRRRRRWLVPAMAAAAAVAVAVVAAVVVNRPPVEQVEARATLAPLATVPTDASGTARVLSDGRMRIDVRNLPLTTGFHEVWLIDPDDLTRMVALGNLSERSDAVLPVPPGVDLNRYRLVDVSDEPHDGNATHSGNSLLRGTLTS